MSPSATRGWVAAFTAAALGILLLQVIALPANAARYAAEVPEHADLVAPLWALAVSAGVAAQLALLVLIRLARRVRDDRSLPPTERPWLALLAGASALAAALVLVAHALLMERGLGGPPPLMLAMLLCIAIGTAGAIASIVALRRTASSSVAQSVAQSAASPAQPAA